MKITIFALIALASITLTLINGCNNKKTIADSDRFTINNKDLEQQLQSNAAAIEKSLDALSSAQEANNPPILNTAPLVTPEGGMGGRADIDWAGPIEPLVQKICDLTNYELKVFGNPPAIPIIISITQKNVTIADLLKNASLQAGNRANIMVFPANKIIELRYNKI